MWTWSEGLVVVEERDDRGQACPAELSRLLSATEGASREDAWRAFTNTYTRLLLHTAGSPNGQYDRALDRYTYVLEQLRADEFRRLRAYTADGRGKFTTWLVVVARRLCLDHDRRRYGRTRAAPTPEASGQSAAATRRRLEDLVAEQIDVATLPSWSNPELEVRVRELRRALASAIEGLEPRDRLLLKLRFEEDLSAREIAGVMDYPTPFHVYRRLNLLLGTLRRRLGRSGVEGSSP